VPITCGYADYDLIFASEIGIYGLKKDSLRLIQGAIRKSAHILNEPDNKTQLAGHLLARLLCFPAPEIQALLEQAKNEKNYPWLRPLTASLTPPGGALVRTLTGHTNYVTAIAITPDGQTVISASNDNTLKVWDLTTNTLRHTLKGHTDRVLAIAMTPDAHFAVSGSKDKTLKLWDVANGIEIKTLIGHTSFVNSVAISSDGQWVISGSWGIGNALKLWDLVENQHYTLAGNLRVNTIAMTPDGQVAISGLDDNTLVLWDCSGIPLHRLSGHTGAIDAVAITPDAKLGLSGSKDTIISGSVDKTLKLWDLASGTELCALVGHKDYITGLTQNWQNH
jgi:WD40 repeat protein